MRDLLLSAKITAARARLQNSVSERNPWIQVTRLSQVFENHLARGVCPVVRD